MIEITTTRKQAKPSFVSCIYGKGGVGKTSLAATSPSPIFIDAEEGTKGLGARGIDIPVIQVNSWLEVGEAWNAVKTDESYETVVIDPTGAFMNLLIEEVKKGGSNPGTMNQDKWGKVKERFRAFIWAVKRSGRHVVFVAHEKIDKDEEIMLRSPEVSANMHKELVNLCDIVGHLRIEANDKRTLLVQPDSKYDAKDRFGILGNKIEDPNVSDMIRLIHSKWDDPPFEETKPEAKST